MKAGFLKVSCLIAGAMAMVACGGNDSGLFGGMQGLYCDKIAEVSVKGKSMAEELKDCSREEGMAIVEEMREYMKSVNEEIADELAPSIEAFKGKVIPCEVSDSVPFTLVSDITVVDVSSPELTLSGYNGLKVQVEGAVVSSDTIYGFSGTSLYILMSTSDGEYVKHMTPYAKYEGERHFVLEEDYFGGTYERTCVFPGDTLKFEFRYDDEGRPSDIISKCEKLHIVNKAEYDVEKKIIKEKEEAWEKQFVEELGLGE